MDEEEQGNFSIVNTKQPDFWLITTILLLLSLGTMMVFSSSAAASQIKFKDAYGLLLKQFIWAISGIVVMFFVSKIHYKFWKKVSVLAFVVSMVLLILVLIPGIGQVYNNARRWFDIAGFTVQPSEIAKIGMVLFFAYIMSADRFKKYVGSFLGFLGCLAILGVVSILLYKEPHISCIIIIGFVSVVIMFIGGMKLWNFLLLGGIGVSGAIFSYLTLAHVRERVNVYLDPFSDAGDSGYQIVQSLLAIGSGGFIGRGLGNSIQKYLYLPEPYNDFIFAIVCEELGFVGAFIVIALFTVFVWRGFKIAMHAPDKFSKLTAAGITTVIAVQVVLNIAVVTSTIPVTGVSLPFFSYGGSSLWIIMAAMGILINISQHSAYEKF